METFAEYILSEKDYIKKMEIAYYLHKREGIFFDTSVVLKTEVARMFIEKMNIDVDENLVLTASLLCGCKKSNNPQDFSKFKSYAKDGADYLKTLGFDDRFCKICEQVNRYSGSTPREPESDILELVDNFCGMVLDRPERRGFPIDEALVLLEYRNLKDKDNKFLEDFKKICVSEKDNNMGYKYDRENGYRNADQIGNDETAFNPELLEKIKAMKKINSNDVRTAINVISCKEKMQEVSKDEKDAVKNRVNIEMTTNENIQQTSKEEKEVVENRANIEMTTNENVQQTNKEEIGIGDRA